MALTKMMCALALGGVFAMAATTPWTMAWAGPDPQSRLAGPFPPKETIYRPECWLDDDSSRHCGGGDRIKQ